MLRVPGLRIGASARERGAKMRLNALKLRVIVSILWMAPMSACDTPKPFTRIQFCEIGPLASIQHSESKMRFRAEMKGNGWAGYLLAHPSCPQTKFAIRVLGASEDDSAIASTMRLLSTSGIDCRVEAEFDVAVTTAFDPVAEAVGPQMLLIAMRNPVQLGDCNARE